MKNKIICFFSLILLSLNVLHSAGRGDVERSAETLLKSLYELANNIKTQTEIGNYLINMEKKLDSLRHLGGHKVIHNGVEMTFSEYLFNFKVLDELTELGTKSLDELNAATRMLVALEHLAQVSPESFGKIAGLPKVELDIVLSSMHRTLVGNDNTAQLIDAISLANILAKSDVFDYDLLGEYDVVQMMLDFALVSEFKNFSFRPFEGKKGLVGMLSLIDNNNQSAALGFMFEVKVTAYLMRQGIDVLEISVSKVKSGKKVTDIDVLARIDGKEVYVQVKLSTLAWEGFHKFNKKKNATAVTKKWCDSVVDDSSLSFLEKFDQTLWVIPEGESIPKDLAEYVGMQLYIKSLINSNSLPSITAAKLNPSTIQEVGEEWIETRVMRVPR